MNTLSKILLFTSLFILLIASSSFAATFTGKVVRVLDGDTIEVLVNTKPVRVRLADIDCPEKKQPFGNAAKKNMFWKSPHMKLSLWKPIIKTAMVG